MEDKSEETLKTGEQNQSQSLDRPKSFILRRRDEIYYFSKKSTRGILKRVPVKDGVFQITELETVLEESAAAQTREEMCSDVPFYRPVSSILKFSKLLKFSVSSKFYQSSSASKDDNVSKSAYHERKRDVAFKSREKVDGYMQQSQSLGTHKNDIKAKYEYQVLMMRDNTTRKEIFSEVPNRPRSLMVNQNNSVSKNDNACEPAYHKQKKEIILKSHAKVDGYKQQSQNLAANKKDLKAKEEHRDAMICDNTLENKNIFLNRYKEIKMQQSKDGDLRIYKDLHGSESDRKHKKFSTSSTKNFSSKKPVEIRKNNSLFSDSWSEKSLSDDLSKMSMETNFIGSKVNQNSSASKNDNACEPAYHKQKRENILKSHAKVDGYMQHLKHLAAHKNDLKAKEEHLDSMIVDNKAQKKNIFLKPYKEIKRQHSKDGDVSICKDLHRSESDVKHKKISSSSLKNCSSKKPVEIESSKPLYSDSCSEKGLSDDFSKMSMKTTFITEL